MVMIMDSYWAPSQFIIGNLDTTLVTTSLPDTKTLYFHNYTLSHEFYELARLI
jgi:hypothetical protein